MTTNLHTLLSLARDFIDRMDMNIRRQGDFRVRVAELRSKRAPHGQQRPSITTNFQWTKFYLNGIATNGDHHTTCLAYYPWISSHIFYHMSVIIHYRHNT